MHGTLVSAEALRDNLDNPSWVVVDCRYTLTDPAFGRLAYREAHIPGAYYASLDEDLAGTRNQENGRHPLPGAETFAAFLRGMGIDDGTQIVAYDAGGDMVAARLWFLAKWIGHDAVAVLDGGFAAWQHARCPQSRETPAPGHGTISARPRAEMTLDARDVLESLQSPQMLVLDARGPDRFAGLNENLDPVGGHIPGAVNRWFKENYTEDGRFKRPQQLRDEFSALGSHPSNIVHQCGSGVSACVNLLAMAYAGLPDSRLYAGSWSEWCADPSRPMIRRTDS